MFMALLRLIVLYSFEMWSLKKDEKLGLAIFEGTVHGKICGSILILKSMKEEDCILMNSEFNSKGPI